MENWTTFFRLYNYLNEILDKKQKRVFVIVCTMSVIGAFLETLGVGAILPLILAILKPETLMDFGIVKSTVVFLGIDSIWGMVLLVSLCVIIVYIIKNFFLIILGDFKNRYFNRLERDLSTMMFSTYIYRPYQFFTDTDTASIERGITSDISGVSSSVTAFCTLFNELMTCLMLGLALIIINPFIAICMIAIAFFITLFMVKFLRKKISICGESARNSYIKKGKLIIETIGGIKEIEVVKRQEAFINKFKNYSFEASRINSKYLTYCILPSRITEIFFIVGLVIVVLASYLYIENVDVLMAQLSALAVASLRILPSVGNITNAINMLVFNRTSVENAYFNIVRNSLREENNNTNESLSSTRKHFASKLSIENISWKYSEELPFVLNDVSLTIEKGQSIGLIGESGNGKTTLADIILGLYIPQRGQILVDGMSIHDKSTMWHKMIGYVPQNIYLYDDTIKNNILFGINEVDCDEERLLRVVKESQMEEFISELPNGINTVLGERGIRISGGQRQRIAIARALYQDPDILVMDEATSALDNDTENAVMDAINKFKGNKTLIIVAHRLSTLAKCDRIFEIINGKVYERNTNEVIEKNDRESSN